MASFEKEKTRWSGFKVMAYILIGLFAIICIAPFILLIVSSLTDNATLDLYGYSFYPRKWSLDAYTYLFANSDTIGRAYAITIYITAVGTTINLLLTCLLAYPLSREDYPLRRIQSFLLFFTMIFNAGLVPTYMVYTQIFNVRNTLTALIVPRLLMNAFYVIIVRTYYSTSIPGEIIESAKIDGASEFKAFLKIILPLSLPIMATVGLLVGINYWNDWNNGLIYVTDPKYFSIQNLLNRMLRDLQFLQTQADVSGEASSLISQIPQTSVRMAIAAIGSLPVLIIYPFFQKYFAKGMTIGAVKG